VAIAVTADGYREILGLWAGDGGEGAKYWQTVLTEIKNRGDRDVLMLVCDGLSALPDAVKRGTRMRPGSLNERLQLLATRAGVPYIDGKKVTSHSWRAGANTDMAEAGVPLAERNKAGRWADGSHTADTVYDRRHGVGTQDPLNAVPAFGGPTHAAVAEARRTG
jgi:integrase